MSKLRFLLTVKDQSFQLQFRYQQNSVQDNLVFLYDGLCTFNENEVAADMSRYRPFSNTFNTCLHLSIFMSLCSTTNSATLTELRNSIRGILHPIFGEIILPHFTGVLLWCIQSNSVKRSRKELNSPCLYKRMLF